MAKCWPNTCKHEKKQKLFSFSDGFFETIVDFSFPFFQSYKCLIVASTDPSTLTSTTANLATEPTVFLGNIIEQNKRI
jgi:hypothetical protein